jgi:hypothetical protein
MTVFVIATLQICWSTNQSRPNKTYEILHWANIIKAAADTKPISKSKANMWFDQTKPFEMMFAERGITKQSSARDTNMCKGWTIAIKDIPKVIKECKSITGEEWHHMFGVLPCIIRGQLKQSGRSFEFEINAGSWMFVTGPDTTILLGSYKKQNEKYFISKAWMLRNKKGKNIAFRRWGGH